MSGGAQPRLDHPWKDVPAPGEARLVAPGLLWARLPLPFRLNHVNVWLLEEDDGWTVIDTGCVTPAIRQAWEDLLAGPMGGARISRVVATHGHVDHIGMTGELVQRFDADFAASFAEWAWARLSHIHDMPGADSTLQGYLQRSGFDEAQTAVMLASRRRFIDMSTPLPGWLSEFRDRQTIRLGGRDWEVITAGGHSYEHSSFYDRQNGILIAGDQILPKISPAITVYEMVPRADPLDDFLQSFLRFADIAEDALVLPSHGLPFYGLHRRIADLQAHHHDRLAVTLDLLRAPRTGVELTREMFPHVEGPEQTGFALGETLAHVNHLVRRGQVELIPDDGTGLRYLSAV